MMEKVFPSVSLSLSLHWLVGKMMRYRRSTDGRRLSGLGPMEEASRIFSTKLVECSIVDGFLGVEVGVVPLAAGATVRDPG